MALTKTQVSELYVSIFGRASEGEGNTYWQNGTDTETVANQMLATDAANDYFGGTLDDQAFVEHIYLNTLNKKATDDPDGIAYWVSELENGASRGKVVSDLVAAVKSYENSTDPVTKAAYDQFMNRVEVSNHTADTLEEAPSDYKISLAFKCDANPAGELNVTADPATVEAAEEMVNDLVPPVQGQVIPLTAGIDYKDGTDGDDIFDGSVNDNGVATLNSADRLDGKAGEDTVVASLTGGTVAATLTNIEKLQIIDSGTSTFNMINAKGVDSIEVKNSSTATTVQNIDSLATDISITDQNQAVTFTYLNSALSGDNNLQVNLSGAQVGSSLSIIQQAGSDNSGLETLTLNSIAGNTNFLTSATATYNNAVGPSTVKKIVVTGSDDLNIATALNASVADVDASTLVGGLTASFANTASNMSVKGGEGKDAITLTANTGNVTVDMGTGDDTFAMTAAATFNTQDTIDGGEGADTLSVQAANAEAITATLSNVSNMEALTLNTAGTNAAATNATYFGDIATVNLAAGTAGVYGVTMDAGEKTLNVGVKNGASTLGNTLTVTDTGTATDDVVNIINANSGTSLTDTFAGKNITSNGYETVNINTGSNITPTAQTLGTVAVNADSTSNANTINISGVNGVTLAAATSNGSGLFTIDASGLTGTATLAMTAAPARTGGVTGDVKVVGSDNASNATGLGDTLLGSTAEKNTINAGAANDTVTGGSLADTIDLGEGNDTLIASNGDDVVDGGTGNDTLNAGTGEQTLKGGAGNDTIVMGATLTAKDVVEGGEGTDTLNISAAATASVAAGVKGFETLALAGAVTQDMIQFTNNSSFTKIAAAATATMSFTNAGASVDTLEITDFAVGADAVTGITESRLVDTANDSLTVNASGTVSSTANAGNTNITTLTVNDEETLTLNSGELATEALNITTLNANDVTTMNFSGTGAIAVTTLTGASKLATVDGAGVTGGISLSAGTSTADMTMTGSLAGANILVGGTGADTITGGALVDTLIGGNGNDTITGNAGNDILNGGLGNDTIDGGIGNDTITGGAGDDTLTGGLGIDKFILSAANGKDTITDYVVADDSIDVTSAGGILGAAIAGSTVVTAASAATATDITAADNQVFYISANGAAANLTTGGTATLTTTDLTAKTLTAVAGYLGEHWTDTAATNTNDVMVALNWTAGSSNDTYLYHITNDGTANVLQAAEIEYVGIVHHDANAVLTTGEFV